MILLVRPMLKLAHDGVNHNFAPFASPHFRNLALPVGNAVLLPFETRNQLIEILRVQVGPQAAENAKAALERQLATK
ncbi:hypothetical protein RA280_46840 [Cupriavidus sp. CV2]|uniref:hypothetical protein n=1 Tax=Cupriavidus ulmosensis TaxID=3065913 RepID=UPI00296B0564|nr:hypothetical protein [Cupriavidus sp. CV2]MDW3689106.1 hypothetical protein [Cupriavidus sp. CV2]